MPDLLASHGLTGCDTEGPCYGIGKGVALKVQYSHAHSHSCFGDKSKALADVINQTIRFMLACMTIRMPFNDRSLTKIVDLKSRSKFSQCPQSCNSAFYK